MFQRPRDESIQRLMDGQSWNEFCDMLKMAGHVILRDSAPATPLDRAEGFRYLSRITRAGLEAFVEYADPAAPELRRMIHETAKMGSDNPDNMYFNAVISGAHGYRIGGSRGTVDYLAFGTQKGGYGEGAGLPPTGFVEAADLQIEADGTFELTVSCETAEGNWLPMTPETGLLIVRQTFLDRAREVPAQLYIERLGADRAPSPFDPATVDAGLAKAARMVGGAAAMFANWAEGFMQHPNELPRFDPELSTRSGGDPNIAYYHGYWQLGPGEALVIDATPPSCQTWNFQLNNHWMESLDYRFHPVVVNKHGARYRPDGSVRIVVAHDDPGVDNWISTVGHRQGTMCLRWVRADHHPDPATRVVATDDLPSL
jgi:hypothetical protein